MIAPPWVSCGACWYLSWLLDPFSLGTPPGGDGEPPLRVHHGLRGAPVRRGTVGGKRFGAFVSGGPPKRSLQTLAVALLDAQIKGGFLLTFE